MSVGRSSIQWRVRVEDRPVTRVSDESRGLEAEQQQQIRQLATDFPALWQDPRTPMREHKRMAALLLEDVTLRQDDAITIHVRFRGGATTTLSLPLPRQIWQVRTASPQALDRIAQPLEHEHTSAQIAATLNAEGLTTGSGNPFTGASVYSHGLKNLRQRLRDGQWRPAAEIRAELGIGRDALRALRTSGRLLARLCNDKSGAR